MEISRRDFLAASAAAIATDHVTMRALALRFGLVLDNLFQAHPPGFEETYYFFGRHCPK